jgi:hypothetical protein
LFRPELRDMQRPQRSARGNQASPAHSNTEGILVVKISYSVEEILDRLNEMREELLVIERSIERIFATEPRNGSGKSRPRKLKIQP